MNLSFFLSFFFCVSQDNINGAFFKQTLKVGFLKLFYPFDHTCFEEVDYPLYNLGQKATWAKGHRNLNANHV